jgi:cytochrome c oxidase assembly protein subunit 15
MSAPALASDLRGGRRRDDRAVGLWLLSVAALIFALAVIGAITRLTESGLSIMEWAPVTGVLPPMSEAEWQRLFALYKTIPEYQQLNRGMTLAEFKTIFWWEWVHRLWGRLIGAVFLAGFLLLLWRGRLRRGLAPHLVAMFALGALQGVVGWYMVASGFAERTDVSQYRLALHLGLALVIYVYVLRVAFGLLAPARPGAVPAGLRQGALGFAGLLGLTVLAGALVAGLNAGLSYNTFPLMAGQLVPDGYLIRDPWWLNAFETPAAVQFNHRVLALATLVAAAGLWLGARRAGVAPAVRRAVDLLGAVALAQVGLGIWTLLAVVPVWLGAVHQAGALVLLGATVWTLSRMTPARTGEDA